MTGARGLIHRSVVAGVVFVAATLSPASALASTGEITRATASRDWTQGSIAGSVSWTGCVHAVQPPTSTGPGPLPPPEPSPEPPYCGWIPYVTVAPISVSADCAADSRRWPDLGEGVSLAWSGGERLAAGVAQFDLPEVPLDGSPGQLFCLAAIERASSGTIPCVPPGEPVPPGWHCPYNIISYFIQFDSASIQAPPPDLGLPSEPAGGQSSLPESLAAAGAPLEPPGHLCRRGSRRANARNRSQRGQARRSCIRRRRHRHRR